MRKAPASVLVLSIIGLLFGALHLLAFAATILASFVSMGRQTPMTEALNQDKVYVAFHAINIFVSLALGLLLIGSCVGSLKLRRWARRCLIVYAWIAVARSIINGCFTTLYAVPIMSKAIPAGGPGRYVTEVNIAMIGALVGIALGIVFPACILYFYSRQPVKDAFDGIFPASPTNFPVLYGDAPDRL